MTMIYYGKCRDDEGSRSSPVRVGDSPYEKQKGSRCFDPTNVARTIGRMISAPTDVAAANGGAICSGWAEENTQKLEKTP